MQADKIKTGAAAPLTGVSRRRIMGGVGVAVAGGLVAGLAGSQPAAAASAGGGAPATGRAGDTLFEFVCRIGQTGADFSGLGYLTEVAGLDRGSLFSAGPRDETHARYTLTAAGCLVTRSVDGAVHALNIEGRLVVRHNEAAGATWPSPASFAIGSPIAAYDLELQDVLTVILPATGIPTLNGTATQDGRVRFTGSAFGRPSMTSRFTATGIGNRSDTGPLDDATATLTIAGSMIAT